MMRPFSYQITAFLYQSVAGKYCCELKLEETLSDIWRLAIFLAKKRFLSKVHINTCSNDAAMSTLTSRHQHFEHTPNYRNQKYFPFEDGGEENYLIQPAS